MTSRNMNSNTDRPTFRSVVTASGLEKSERPRLQHSRPTSIKRRISSISKDSICSKRENSSGSYAFKPTELRPLPFLYPIEKTSRIVEEDNTTTADLLLPTVASRIMNCLRDLSIQAIYDNKNATASLTTIEGVQMQLYLWDTSSKTNHGNKKILVELQRRKGDSMIFHRCSRNILNTAVDNCIAAYNTDDSKRQIRNNKKHCAGTPKLKRRLLSTMVNDSSEEQEYENTIVALEIVHTLLKKDRNDAKKLGLESLCLMTDPHGYMSSGTAPMPLTKIIASQVILFGGTTATENMETTSLAFPFQQLKEIIVSLIQFDTRQEDDGLDDSDEFRNLALTIFANALDVLSSSSTGSYGSNITAMGNVVSTLVTDISRADMISSHTAYLSIKCLRLLCTLSNDKTKQKVIMDLGGADRDNSIMHAALDFGIRTHQKLELECKKFLNEILLPSN